MIGDLYIAVRFFPKNIYRHGDIDNLMKTLLDAMKGHVFFDDSQVRSMYVIMEDSCTESPRVDVRIQPHSKQKPSCLLKHRRMTMQLILIKGVFFLSGPSFRNKKQKNLRSTAWSA